MRTSRLSAFTFACSSLMATRALPTALSNSPSFSVILKWEGDYKFHQVWAAGVPALDVSFLWK